MKIFREIFSKISTLLILSYQVIRKILLDIFKWYDLWAFLIILYGMIQVNIRFFEKPQLDQNLLQNFIEWYAIFYALALTVIIGEAWNRLNKINSEIDREADALKLLLQTGKMFPSKDLFGPLFQAVYAYADCVLKYKFQDHRSQTLSHKLLQSIRNCVDQMIQGGDSQEGNVKEDNPQEFLKAELLRQYCEFYDARGDRFDLIEQRMPPHIWFVLGTFSLVWLWGFVWLEFHEESLKTYVIGCTTSSIGYLFYVARALNDPTKGAWKLTFKPFKENLFETEF
jgi:hypothetical protein